MFDVDVTNDAYGAGERDEREIRRYPGWIQADHLSIRSNIPTHSIYPKKALAMNAKKI